MTGKNTDLQDRCLCRPHLRGLIALLAVFAIVPTASGTDTSTRLLSEAGAKFIKGGLGGDLVAVGPVDPFSTEYRPDEIVPASATGATMYYGMSQGTRHLLAGFGIRRLVQFFWFKKDQVRNDVWLTVYAFDGEDSAKDWWDRNARKLGYRSLVPGVSLAEEALDKDPLSRMALFRQYVFDERRIILAEVAPGTAINACINVLSATPFQPAVESLRKGMSREEVLGLLGEPHARLPRVEIPDEDQVVLLTGDVWQYTYEPGDRYDLYLAFTDGGLGQWLRKETRSTICCVVEDTPVEGEDGPLDISDLRVGDRIWGYDLERQERTLVTVLSVREARAPESLLIGEKLRVTKWHTVYVDGEWPRADRVQPTDRVLSSDGRSVEAGDIRRIQGTATVYDVGVTHPHNFFAGGILVHNRKGP